ncbi:MAG: transcription antitermination protein NusB [Leptospirales bacterium]|jgi:N utilization substance protein B
MSKSRGHKKSGVQKHPNSHAREVALQALYQVEIVDKPMAEALEFGWLNEAMQEDRRVYCQALIEEVMRKFPALNERISKYASKDIRSISSINRSILRIGFVELDRGETEAGIIIDDLLNLTRKYDGEESVPFINGILGAQIRKQQEG